MEPAPILCVGIVCFDIINHLDRYPREDEDIRAKKQTRRSGGNCTNTAKVLSLIGRQCEFLGSLGSGPETDYCVAELDSLGVCHGQCPVYEACTLPTSYVALNTTNGSRTIIHFRDLPELSYEDFLKVDITKYGWIHFEGRNPLECCKMIRHVREYNELHSCNPVRISVEVEKLRSELMDLLPLGDMVIISKDLAKHYNCKDKVEAVTKFRNKVKKDAVVICPWGDDGAAASDEHGKVYSSVAHSPHEVVDTLGAGDTFNAAVIHYSSIGRSLQDTLNYACKLAGFKCGILGYGGLQSSKIL